MAQAVVTAFFLSHHSQHVMPQIHEHTPGTHPSNLFNEYMTTMEDRQS
jgi:hypothetical protein